MWQNNADWERLCAPLRLGNGSGLAMAAHGRLYAQRFLGGVAVILLLLVSAGGWWWHTARVALYQVEAELAATVQPELSAVAHSGDPLLTSFANFAPQPQSSVAMAPPRLNGATIVEQLADRQALAEYQATMAGQGRFVQGYRRIRFH